MSKYCSCLLFHELTAHQLLLASKIRFSRRSGDVADIRTYFSPFHGRFVKNERKAKRGESLPSFSPAPAPAFAFASPSPSHANSHAHSPSHSNAHDAEAEGEFDAEVAVEPSPLPWPCAISSLADALTSCSLADPKRITDFPGFSRQKSWAQSQTKANFVDEAAV